MRLVCCFGVVSTTVAGEQWQSPLLSPNRASLA